MIPGAFTVGLPCSHRSPDNHRVDPWENGEGVAGTGQDKGKGVDDEWILTSLIP